MSRDPLTVNEIVELIESMMDRAEKDYDEAVAAGKPRDIGFWDGWQEGLWTLREHIRGGVKASCFPVGSCECHPFVIKKETRKERLWKRVFRGLLS